MGVPPVPGPITRSLHRRFRHPLGHRLRGRRRDQPVLRQPRRQAHRLGPSREVAINRALRALGELRVEGVATTIPADIAILEHDDFRNNEHSTKWVEEVLDLSEVSATSAERADDDEPKIKRELDVEVNGKRFSVAMWVPESAGAPAAAGGGGAARRRSGGGASGGGSGSGDVTVPMQGTIVKINVAVGDEVEAGDAIVVLEQ